MRLVIAVPLITIAFIAAAPAEEKMSDADAKQKVEVVLNDVRDTLMRNDAAGYAKHFASDAVIVSPTGETFRGHEGAVQRAEHLIKHVGGIKSVENTVDEAHALSDGWIWAIGHATVEGNVATVKDHWAVLNAPGTSGWTVRMLSLGVDLPTQPQTAERPSTR